MKAVKYLSKLSDVVNMLAKYFVFFVMIFLVVIFIFAMALFLVILNTIYLMI